jgi:hypothetical protein
MAESKEFIAWVKEQATKNPADSKISNLQKATSKYVLGKYTTWGDLYSKYGVKEAIPKPKPTKTSNQGPAPVKTSKDISNNIKRLNGILERQREALKSLGLKDPEFKTTEAAIKKTLSEIEANKKSLDDVIKKEKAAKAKTDLATAKEDLAYAKASNDAAAIKKAQDALNIANRDVQGKDSDGDGIPDTIDAEPNTPKKTSATDKAAADKVIADKAAADKVISDKAVVDKEKVKTPAELEAEALNTAAEKDFALPETLFKNIPSLNALLKKYVDEKWTPDKLRKAIRDDLWFKQNSAEIKTRYVQYYNFRDLQASGQAKGTTDYEMQIAKIEATLKKRAVALGSAAASDPAALRKAAENLYITNRSEDESFVTDLLAASIRTTAGMIGSKVTEGYSGQALNNYNLLVKAARDNGFQVSDIIPGGASEQQVLQGIAAGTIDVNRIIADSRKLAAQGQPQYVRDLLAQGYNLNQVYAPYRQTMANILEIDDPNQIDLNDPVLRSAITDKGDMNIYDFKKALRRDDRWQYTEQAKQDVSTAALDVLRDFGFQG